MEDKSCKNLLLSRKNESRSLLRKCFKNPLFSLVPFEIWRDLIVSNADLKTIVLLSQICHAFKEIADDIGRNNLNLALMFRNESQIRLARKHLLLCASNNNKVAMFYVGNALCEGGFGYSHVDDKAAAEWFEKSASLGHGGAMACLAFLLRYGHKLERDEERSSDWGRKAISSGNMLAIGYCHDFGLGTEVDSHKAFLFYEAAAIKGNEFAQYYLGLCFECGERDYEKAFFWYLKSAKQGVRLSQIKVADMYREGKGCERNEELANFWNKKVIGQKLE